jgi:hypothetical protein
MAFPVVEPARKEGGPPVNAVVVYESHWGNTAAIARAVAEGLGPDTHVLTTDEATSAAISDADLIVAGAPVIAFRLASEKMRASLASDETKAPTPPDLSHPSMGSWLKDLPHGHGRSAAFETRIWWSPRGATGDIERGLQRAGYPPLAKAGRFVVTGTYGPLNDGEVDRARHWGAELAASMKAGDRSRAAERELAGT